MTRVYTDGAEMGDTVFFDSVGSGGAASTAQKRSGGYSYTGNTNCALQKNFTGISEGYFRFGWRSSNVGNGSGNKILIWRAGTTELGSIRFTSGKFTCYTSTGTLAATGSFMPVNDTWYLIEVRVKIADSGNIQLKIDGVSALDIDYAGDTKPGTDSTFDNAIHNVVYTSNYWFDDLALNNTSGGVDDSWCGDGHVILLSPNADGDSSQWVGSDGNSASNYALVDELPPSATDYVESSTSGNQDLYNLTACGLSNVTIQRVWPEARAADTVAAGGQIYLPVKTNSTQYDGTAVSLLTTYTKYLIGDVRKTNPQTGSAWSTTQLDALQVGCKVV